MNQSCVNSSMEPLLIVDDQEPVRGVFKSLLEDAGFPCLTAGDGVEALSLLADMRCSLLLADIDMPNMNGVALLDAVKKRYPEMAVLMMSGVAERQVAMDCVKNGAYGYVAKPASLDELYVNVTGALQRRDLEMANRLHSESLEELVATKTRDLELACRETMMILSRAAEFRDNETAQHNKRMGMYCEFLAKKAGLPAQQCERIRQASPLHDVGKIGVSDQVLLKPGRLTEEEFAAIKQHCEIGYRILVEASSKVLQLGATIAYTHHEKYDGSGYPQGLKANEIPLEGRIAAISDVFDALTSERVYKKAVSVEQAVDILRGERGKHFDPQLLDIFLANLPGVEAIKKGNSDR